MHNLTGQTLKGYELRDRVGTGGFGAVYRAYQPIIKREVAIKVILPQHASQPNFIRRFEVEAELVARLEHPHIVPLYDYWRDPDGAYLIMRWLPNNLHERLVQPLRLPEISRILDHIGAALATAHRHGIVHRDLKPANILLDDEHNAYLADFGIAKSLQMPTDLEDTKDGQLVGSPAYLAPEQIRNEGTTTPAADIYSLGIVVYEMLTGHHPFRTPDIPLISLLTRQMRDPLPPLQDFRPDLPPALESVLRRATEKAPEDRYPDVLQFVSAFQSAIAPITSEITRTPTSGLGVRRLTDDTWTPADQLISTRNPYKGLKAFKEADAEDFYGREALIQHLLDRLRPGETDPDLSRFLAVVGPSGSGKSSVVRAGLITALRGGRLPGSERWFIVDITPGSHPIEELEAALLRIATNPPASLIEQLERDERGLLRAVRRILPEDDSELLLVIDQFEEVFTQSESPEKTRHFLDLLHTAVTDERSPLRVIITLRADFYDRPLMMPVFSELMRQRTEVVTPLTPEQLERTIALPAENAGVHLEPGVIAAMIAEVNEQPGALPLLQYALTELFDQRAGDVMTLHSYNAIGGTLGALARRADDVYQQLLPRQRNAARQMFLRLVTPGEGMEDTRRRATRAELIALGADREIIQTVIDAFDRSRLLTFDRDPLTRAPTVEVAHEALIREWGRLREWLDESRHDIRQQRLLAHAATEWQTADHDESYLLRGARLEQFRTWADETLLALTSDERDYLNASIAEDVHRLEREAERQAREARLEQRSRFVMRVLVIVFLAAAIVATALAVIAFGEQATARDERDNAREARETARVERDIAREARATSDASASLSRSLALAASAEQASDSGDAILALALAFEANQLPEAGPRARRILAELALVPGAIDRLIGHNNAVMDAAFSPDGTQLLSVSWDGGVIMWDVFSREPLWGLRTPGTGFSAAYSPDGSRVAIGFDTTVLIAEPDTGAELLRIRGTNVVYWDLAFTPDSTQLIGVTASGNITLWDVDTGRPRATLVQDVGSFPSVDVSPDGNTVLISQGVYENESGDLILWDITTDTVIRHYEGYQRGIFDATGERIMATNTRQNYTVLIDTETGQELSGVPTGGLVFALAPDGVTGLIANPVMNTLMMVDMVSGRLLNVLSGHGAPITTIAFHPDGNRAITGAGVNTNLNIAQASTPEPDSGADNSLIVWDLRGAVALNQITEAGPVRAVAYHPEGRFAAIASENTVIVRDVVTGGELSRFTGHEDPVISVAFSPDGALVLSGDTGGMVYLWRLRDGQSINQTRSAGDAASAVDFHPDGSRALISWFNNATGSGSPANIWLWDLQTGRVSSLIGHADSIYDAEFSPDGETIISASRDRSLVLWDVSERQLIQRLTGHSSTVWSGHFSPDGRYLLSGSGDTTLILWDVVTGQPLRRFVGHQASVLYVAYSPDGNTALSASADDTVILWEVATGEPLFEYRGHTDTVTEVTYSPDGQYALSASNDGTVRRWRVPDILRDPQQLLSWTVTHRYVRTLTCIEREQYEVTPFCEDGTPPPTGTPYPTLIATATTTLSPTPDAALVTQPPTTTPSPTRTLTPTLPTPTATITVTPLPTSTPAPAGVISPGIPERGTIMTRERETWSFVGNRGQVLTLHLNAAGLTITLLNSERDVLAVSDTLIEDFILPEDDVYFVVVEANFGGGAYILEMSLETPETE